MNILNKLAVAAALVALAPGFALAQSPGDRVFLAAPRDITVRFVPPPISRDGVKPPYRLIMAIDGDAKRVPTQELPNGCVDRLPC